MSDNKLIAWIGGIGAAAMLAVVIFLPRILHTSPAGDRNAALDQPPTPVPRVGTASRSSPKPVVPPFSETVPANEPYVQIDPTRLEAVLRQEYDRASQRRGRPWKPLNLGKESGSLMLPPVVRYGLTEQERHAVWEQTITLE